jgi:hemolysin III
MLHAVGAPLVLLAGIVLVLFAPENVGRVAGISFTLAALANFSTSAAMHRGRWNPRGAALIARLDHISIFVLIAGSYTAFGLLLLHGDQRVVMITAAWVGASIGITCRLFWFGAPRWVHTSAYLVLGWVAIFYAGEFARFPNPAVPILIAAGGLCYSVGGLVYGFGRPNPWPRWFGFHEVFHTFAVAGFVAHYAAIYTAVHSSR